MGKPADRNQKVSIHALREEGDPDRAGQGHQLRVSIHALREEGDVSSSRTLPSQLLFLSTPSARRATPAGQPPRVLHRRFYPRPPRGGRHLAFFLPGVQMLVSIHALREEGDE